MELEETKKEPTGSVVDYYNSVKEDNDNTFELAKEQNYKELLDKDIAISNAKQNAMKYAQNYSTASGFGNTGVSESSNNQILTTYANALNDNQANYYNANATALEQKNSANQVVDGNIASENSKYETTYYDNLMTDLESASTIADKYKVLANGNYYDTATGQFTEEFNNLNPYLQKIIKGYINEEGASTLTSSGQTLPTGQWYESLNDVLRYDYGRNNENGANSEKDLDKRPGWGTFDEEQGYLDNLKATGELQEGYYKIVNGGGDVAYIYYKKNHAGYYQANKADAVANGYTEVSYNNEKKKVEMGESGNHSGESQPRIPNGTEITNPFDKNTTLIMENGKWVEKK